MLADSDSDEAQKVKLKVRDQVLEYMKQTLPGNEDMVSASQTKKWAKEHLREIEDIAEKVIREEGYSYRAKAEVSVCYFPDKRYGDITFPQGYYEALRIKLGKAKGHNWWCVLYPNLCFTSSTCAVVDEEGKEELKEVLTDEEYETSRYYQLFSGLQYFSVGRDRIWTGISHQTKTSVDAFRMADCD